MRRLKRSRTAYLVVGVLIGLVVGLNLQGAWPSIPLHATATHGQENFAIATGYVDSEAEALYFLDFLTGDLKAAVLAVRGPRAGKFNSVYSYNILNDLGGAKDNKNPKYLLVTGELNLPRGAAAYQMSRSVCYVAEANTGLVCAYMIPWNTAAQAAGKPVAATFVLLDKAPFRTLAVRDQ